MKNIDTKAYIKELKKWLAKGRMSPMLRQAIEDTMGALKKGDLQLAYQLTACKSFIVGTMRDSAKTRRFREGRLQDGRHNFFRESDRLNTKALGNSLYSLLDGMHHNLAFAIEALPSGMVVLSRNPQGGITQHHMAHTGTHPVIACMKMEQQEIEEQSRQWAAKPLK